MSNYVGIDPGWSTCGVHIQGGDSHFFVPKSNPSLLKAAQQVADVVPDGSQVIIERFVAYEGKQTSSSEDILMFIGAVVAVLQSRTCNVTLVRAIDWKQAICKHLVRTKGFSNPYPRFDKEYSKLVAKELSGITGVNDHIADAICLSYYLESLTSHRK